MVTKTYHRSLIVILALIAITGVFLALRMRGSSPHAPPTHTEPALLPPISPKPMISLPPSQTDTTSWKHFTDEKLGFSLQYPASVMIDPRQTTTGRLDAFIFTQDKKLPLPGSIPMLMIAGNQGQGKDALTVFQQGDCGKPCPVSLADIQPISINNAVGITSPRAHDMLTYYLTDEEKKGPVINIYIGGTYDRETPETQKKIALYEQIIRTLILTR